jgi:TRAP-type C4-dicarboxylate transport system permease small subunit
VDRLTARIGQVCGWGAGLGLAVLAAVCALQILWRYVLNAPLPWPEEVARLLLVWLTYLGAVSVTESGLHVAIGVVHERLPPSGRRVADLLGELVALGFAAALTAGGLAFMASMRGILLPALQLPLNVLCAAVPVAGGLHVVLHGAALVRWVRAPLCSQRVPR